MQSNNTSPKDIGKPSLNIRINAEQDDIIELLDNCEIPENFKKDVLIPYLKHLYNDLTNRNPNPGLGIPKSDFLKVILLIN